MVFNSISFVSFNVWYLAELDWNFVCDSAITAEAQANPANVFHAIVAFQSAGVFGFQPCLALWAVHFSSSNA